MGFAEGTLSAWNELLKALVSGSVPVLTYIDVLQSDLTGVTHEVVTRDIRKAKTKDPMLKNLPDKNDYSIFVDKRMEKEKGIYVG